MHVLIVDDDLALADVLSFTMRRAGFEVTLAHDGQMALERWKSTSPDLIILDLNLPRLSGFKVCQQIRARSEVPIIILSVLDEEEDIISGLKYGADDYIIKPFSPRQVIARAQAVLRRTQQQKVQNGILQAGGLTLYTSRNELHRGERVVARLTRLECQLMEILLLNYGQVVPAGLLIDAVWGPGRGERGMLKQLVYRLRHKLYTDPAHSVCLEAVSGAGYCLKAIEGSPESMATAAPREPEEEQAF
jgi:DNA-binding response OmpR family regulator